MFLRSGRSDVEERPFFEGACATKVVGLDDKAAIRNRPQPFSPPTRVDSAYDDSHEFAVCRITKLLKHYLILGGKP